MLNTSKLRVFTMMLRETRIWSTCHVFLRFRHALAGLIRSTHRIFGLNLTPLSIETWNHFVNQKMEFGNQWWPRQSIKMFSTMVVHYALWDIVPSNNVLVPYTTIMVQHLHTPWGQEWPTRKFPGIYAVDTRLEFISNQRKASLLIRKFRICWVD